MDSSQAESQGRVPDHLGLGLKKKDEILKTENEQVGLCPLTV